MLRRWHRQWYQGRVALLAGEQVFNQKVKEGLAARGITWNPGSGAAGFTYTYIVSPYDIWRGVTAHALLTSSRLDFTPGDEFDMSGSTALEPGASWVHNNLWTRPVAGCKRQGRRKR